MIFECGEARVRVTRLGEGRSGGECEGQGEMGDVCG
jgi:hypothetical protein